MDKLTTAQKQEAMAKVMELRGQLFDIANSFAGNETGHIAVMLHESCNWFLRAEQHFTGQADNSFWRVGNAPN